MTRVLALVTDAFGGYGGIAQYNRDFLSGLANMDEVSVIDTFPRLAPDREQVDIPGLNVYKPIHNKITYAARTSVHALSCRPDVIFNAHIYHSPLSRKLASITKAKVISQLHGTEVWEPLPESILSALRDSALVFCVSNHTKQRYLDQATPASDNAVVLHNTVGAAFEPGDRNAARKRFRLNDEVCILSVGRLDARKGGYKGHERVIRLLPSLQSAHGNVRYLIAGIGDDRPRLEALTQELGLEDSVEFLGKVPLENLPDLYRAADVFALPSTGEGFGIVFLEAMACGTPAIGLDVGGAPDALPSDLGTCVPPDQFDGALMSLVATTSNDRGWRANETRARFGKATFDQRLKDEVKRVL